MTGNTLGQHVAIRPHSNIYSIESYLSCNLSHFGVIEPLKMLRENADLKCVTIRR